jgi:CubicO group peptidase (beta-lactamase class C family)
MTKPRKTLTRRAALAGLAGAGGLTAAAQLGGLPGSESVARADPDRSVFREVPIKGKAGPGLELFDAAMLQVMERHGIPGGAFALAKGGKLLLAKGYGWSNVAQGIPVEPTTRFGLASLSKVITAIAVLKLVESGKLGLDDKILDILKDIKPPTGARVDPRLADVTVRYCLNHSVGWDRSLTGDPINWEPQICRAYGVIPPLSSQQFLSFMLTQPLNFKPGTDAKYCNVGAILLGEVIARISRQTYERFVIENVWKPVGVTKAALQGFEGKYTVGEAVRHLAGTLIALPAAFLPMVNASGGWAASAVDLARLLTSLDGSRGEPILGEKMRKAMIEAPPEPLKPREDGSWFGLGWDSAIVKDNEFAYFKDGSYQGMRTYMKRLPNGLNWVLLYNASMEFDPNDLKLAANTVHEIRKVVEGIEKHPDIDLFKEYT